MSLQKQGMILENKVLQDIDLSKKSINEHCTHNQILLRENHF